MNILNMLDLQNKKANKCVRYMQNFPNDCGSYGNRMPRDYKVYVGNTGLVTPHVSDVSGVIVLTSSVCVCVCLSVTTLISKRTDVQTGILAWRSSGRISRSSS